MALWENPNYVSPAKYRQQFRLQNRNKYVQRVQQKVNAELTKPEETYKLTPYDDLFKEKNETSNVEASTTVKTKVIKKKKDNINVTKFKKLVPSLS